MIHSLLATRYARMMIITHMNWPRLRICSARPITIPSYHPLRSSPSTSHKVNIHPPPHRPTAPPLKVTNTTTCILFGRRRMVVEWTVLWMCVLIFVQLYCYCGHCSYLSLITLLQVTVSWKRSHNNQPIIGRRCYKKWLLRVRLDDDYCALEFRFALVESNLCFEFDWLLCLCTSNLCIRIHFVRLDLDLVESFHKKSIFDFNTTINR